MVSNLFTHNRYIYCFLLFFFILLLGSYNISIAYAASVNITINLQINAGLMTLSSDPTSTLSTITLSTSSQNATGDLGLVDAADSRGTGVGWTLTDAASNFIQVETPITVSGSHNTLSSGGTYTGTTAGTYTVTIATGGSAGVSTYTVSGLETQGTTTTGSTVLIGTHGVTATFGAATYTTGDSWTIRVDLIPVTDFTQSPGSVSAIVGSLTGMNSGSSHTFSSTSDTATLASAPSGDGMGEYTLDPNLSLAVPANTYTGSYSATITLTAQ